MLNGAPLDGVQISAHVTSEDLNFYASGVVPACAERRKALSMAHEIDAVELSRKLWLGRRAAV